MSYFTTIATLAFSISSSIACAQTQVYRAVAADFLGESEYVGTGSNLIEASYHANHQCEQQHSQITCEITHIRNTPITTAREIKLNIDPKTPLMMWHTKNRTSQASIVGSVHALKAALFPLPEPINQAFEKSTHVVVETNVLQTDDGSASQAWMVEQLTFGPGQSLRSSLSRKHFKNLQNVLQDTGLRLEQINRLKPAFAATNIVNARLRSFGFDRDWGMEQQYLQRAASRPIISLETTKQQITLLAQAAMEIQLRILHEALVSDEELELMIKELISAWWHGEDAKIAQSFQDDSRDSLAYEQFQRELLDARNIRMATEIIELLGSPGHYFVLVGAAHLAGSNSVINILEQRGLALERINHDGSVETIKNIITGGNNES